MSPPAMFISPLRSLDVCTVQRAGYGVLRTSGELGLVGDIILIELVGLLLGLLVVNGVGTSCGILSAFYSFNAVSEPRAVLRKGLWRLPPCPEGILKVTTVLSKRSCGFG